MSPMKLEFRLRVLERRHGDATRPRKALVPAWLLEDMRKEGLPFDVSGRPIFDMTTPFEARVTCD